MNMHLTAKQTQTLEMDGRADNQQTRSLVSTKGKDYQPYLVNGRVVHPTEEEAQYREKGCAQSMPTARQRPWGWMSMSLRSIE